MAILQLRCCACHTFHPTDATKCPSCGASDQWEKVCVDDTVKGEPTLARMLNEKGEEVEVEVPAPVVFFAYEEAAKVGVPVPDWAQDATPQAPAAKTVLERLEAVEARLDAQASETRLR